MTEFVGATMQSDKVIEATGALNLSVERGRAMIDQMIGDHEAAQADIRGSISAVRALSVRMRQRLDQVFDALRELDGLVDRARNGAPPERSLLDVIEGTRKVYVMDSQRTVYDKIVANDVAEPVAAQRIELL